MWPVQSYTYTEEVQKISQPSLTGSLNCQTFDNSLWNLSFVYKMNMPMTV